MNKIKLFLLPSVISPNSYFLLPAVCWYFVDWISTKVLLSVGDCLRQFFPVVLDHSQEGRVGSWVITESTPGAELLYACYPVYEEASLLLSLLVYIAPAAPTKALLSIDGNQIVVEAGKQMRDVLFRHMAFGFLNQFISKALILIRKDSKRGFQSHSLL